MKQGTRWAASALVAAVLAPMPAQAQSSVVVDDDGVQCPRAEATSISGAVELVPAGGTIRVCAGTYREWLDVDKTLRIIGPREPIDALDCFDPAPAALDDLDPSRFAVVEAPEPSTFDNVVDVRADGVRVSGLVVQGAGGSSGSYVSAGVATRGDGAGYRLDHNLIRLNGLGVDLGGDGTSRTRLDHNCIRDNAYGVASQTMPLRDGRIDHNETSRHAVLDFEVGWSHAATTETRFDHNHSVVTGTHGYLLENTSDVLLDQNRTEGGTRAVTVLGGNERPRLLDNELVGWSAFGMLFSPPPAGTTPRISTDVEVTRNTVTGLGSGPTTATGLGFARTATGAGAVDGGVVERNVVRGSAGLGVSVQPGNPGLFFGRNVIEDNLTYGIHARPGTSGVVFERNRILRNGVLDVLDEGTGNHWIRNECSTDAPPATACASDPRVTTY